MNIFGKKSETKTIGSTNNTKNVVIKPVVSGSITNVPNTEGELTPLGRVVEDTTVLSKKIYELAELAKFIHYKDNIKMWQIYSSSEIVNTIDSLLFAKGYLGKLMGELGTPTPYQNDGKRNSVNDIEPVANISTPDISSFRSLNLVQKIDFLREEVQKLISVDILILSNDLVAFTQGGVDLNNTEKRREIFLHQAFVHLTAAKMWLGFELGRIRDSK